MTDRDPFVVLGLDPSCTAEDVATARRRLSKLAHPDVGGDEGSMRRINEAADEALRRVGAPIEPGVPNAQTAASGDDRCRFDHGSVHDHPSFTVEALPVVAYEGLLLVAGWLGEVIDDEPPYGLEVALADPERGWCRLDLVPDAGASTVSVSVAGEPGGPAPDIVRVRDAWIDGLNALDWTALDPSVLDPSRPPPS